MTKKMMRVNLWGSNPDETDNDDCWTGEDFATLAEAQACLRAILADPNGHPLARSCGHWEFVELDGPDAHLVAANPDQKTCERHRRELAREDAEWRREIANEAGMLHGCDGYNEVMGW